MRKAGLALCAAAALGVWCWLPPGLSLRGVLPAREPASSPSDQDLRALARRVVDTWVAGHPANGLAWSWGEGVLVVGLERARRLTGRTEIDAYLHTYMATHAQHGIRVVWSDDALPALAAAELVLKGETAFLPLVERVVDYSMHAPRTRSGMLLHLGRARLPVVRDYLPDVWVDSLFHIVPTLMRYSRITQAVRYRDEAARQLRLFVRALADPGTGLVTHAYNDRAAGERVPSFAAHAFWARGNGWMLATLVDALSELPASHPDRPLLLAAAQRLAAALARVQDRSGLFHTLLLRRDSYLETAGSALIVAGLAQGVRLQLFPASTRAAVELGARGLMASVRSEHGRAVVSGTSLGTNPIAGMYAVTPTADEVCYGVGAWLIAANEIVLSRQAP